MKKILFLAILLFSNLHSFAQKEQHYFQAPDKVTVYQQGAMITQNYKVNLSEGTNLIQLDSLPQTTDSKSIRISLPIKTTVLSYDFKYNANNQGEIDFPRQVKQLEDSLSSINEQLNEVNAVLSVLSNEEIIIQNFRLEGNKEKGVTVEEFTKYTQYYEAKLTEVKKNILKQKLQQTKLNEIIKDLTKRLEDARKPFYRKPYYYVELYVNAETAGMYNLELTYFTTNAGWTPYYELRASSTEEPIDIIYKANAWQNTGYDWKDVQMTLSTRNPNMSNVLPNLSIWYLRVMNYQKNVSYDDALESPLSPMSTRSSRVKEAVILDKSSMANVIGTVESKYFSEEYSPKAKYNIKSDGLKRSITLNQDKMEAIFDYYAAPELDLDAFLTAKVPNWSQYRLLPGEANIYFEESYIGKTYIDPYNSTDTLTLSMGRDKGIVIKRELQKDMTETKFLSKNVQKTFGYKISVKNMKKNKIMLTLQERIPISTHEDIEVELIESSSAELDKATGFLKWIIEMQPNQTAEKKFVFKVDAPSGSF